VPAESNVCFTERPVASTRPSALKSQASSLINLSSVDVEVKVTGAPAVGSAGS
jgi:hypothetical protein